MNNTAVTNAVRIPSTMIAMTTPVIMYTTEPDQLSMLALLLRLDTGPLMIFVALEVSGGIEVIPSSVSDEVSIMVVLPT